MITIEETLEAYLPSTKFEHQALVNSVPKDYRGSESPQISLNDFSENISPFTKLFKWFKKNRHLNDKKKIKEPLPQLLYMIQKLRKREIKILHVISQSLKEKYNTLIDPCFPTSNFMPPMLKPSSKPGLHRDDSLISQLWTEKFQLKHQLTPLYMASTQYKLLLNPSRYNYHNISYTSEHLAPHGCWSANNQKVFTLQMNFLRPSVFDLRTDG